MKSVTADSQSTTYRPNTDRQVYRVLNLYRLTGIQAPDPDPVRLYKDRLAQRGAGLVRGRDDDPEWFHDHRYLPEQQAQYLRKLSELREELISKQRTKVNGTKTNDQPLTVTVSTRRDDRPKPAPVANPNMMGAKNAFTERQRKLQEKQELLDRRHRKRTPLSLHATGQQLIESASPLPVRKSGSLRVASQAATLPQRREHPLPGSRSLEHLPSGAAYEESVAGSEPGPAHPSLPALRLPYLSCESLPSLSPRMPRDTSYNAVNSVIELQRARLREIMAVPAHKPPLPPGAPSRQAAGPGRLDRRSRTSHENFVRQKPISLKTRAGVYRGNVTGNGAAVLPLQFLRADADETRLPSAYLDTTLAQSQTHNTRQARNPLNMNGHVQTKGPVYVHTDAHALNDSSGFIAPPTSPTTAVKVARDLRYLKAVEEQRKYHLKYHTGNTAAQNGINVNRDDCPLCEEEKALKGQEQNDVSSFTQDKENNHNYNSNSRVNFEQNPLETNGPTANNNPTRGRSETLSNGVAAGTPRRNGVAAGTPRRNGVAAGTPRRQIFVDLSQQLDTSASLTRQPSVPNLTFNSPSPTKSSCSDTPPPKPSQLIKTFRQNELREKEVRDLLQDVHEINSYTHSISIGDWAEAD